jgi:hypothetical protein
LAAAEAAAAVSLHPLTVMTTRSKARNPVLSTQGISEYGIFHGIANWQKNKPLNVKNKNGLFIIEWE